ncbi:MAG: ABC transporter permease [SAR324 cluster bacterium]|nr:ABC transporter permease [SAR324 cluster bacterium]
MESSESAKKSQGIKPNKFKEHLRKWAPVIVLIGLCTIFAMVNKRFIDPWNMARLLSSAAIPLVLTMGATYIILMGSIDLSVEGILALTGVTASLLVANDFTDNQWGYWAIPVAIAIGGLLGFCNGYLHVKLKTPSFMTTLGIGFACIGIATLFLSGVTVRISDSGFRAIYLKRLLGLPVAVWIAFAAVAFAYFFQQRTRIGRWIYAIGGDEETAEHAGIPIGRTRIFAFTMAGFFCGLGGVLAAAQLGQGHALMGSGRLFLTITAVVLGGTALSGGTGSVLNTVVGVLIVVVVNNGMILLGMPSFVQQGVQGLLIIIAVALALDRSRVAIMK